MPPVLVLDTYSLFFRAHFALPAMCTSTGEPTGALYGFSSLLLKLLREQQPLGLSFALDAPARTFRHERFSDYKAGRARMPETLGMQLGRLDELIEALAAPAYCVPGFEADDILATLARELEAAGHETLVVSGDRDALQLAHGSTRVLFAGARGKTPTLYDAETVQKRFGVPPERLPSFVALVGDASDNLPGVPGIGKGIAAKLLRDQHDIDELLENIERTQPARVRELLRTHAEQMRATEQLARLDCHVPLGAGARHAPIDAPGFERLRALFTELEFQSLLGRLKTIEDKSTSLTGASR